MFKINISEYDSYHYLRLAHISATCFGLPYTRRKIKRNIKYDENVAGNNYGTLKLIILGLNKI